MTMAAMPSTSGGTRGITHGSWRPCTTNVWGSPSKLQVSCACEIDDTALTPMRKTMFSPELMPPSVPPAWFVLHFNRPLPILLEKQSLWLEPLKRQDLKPSPISKALTAGNDIIAFPSSASNLSKHGSPTP